MMNNQGMYSFHPAGANIGVADGSVRFLADTTSFDAIVGLYGGSVEGLPERP
jgi:prepilin-type processing-associated H-X9-DG protein